MSFIHQLEVIIEDLQFENDDLNELVSTKKPIDVVLEIDIAKEKEILNQFKASSEVLAKFNTFKIDVLTIFKKYNIEV